MTVGPASSAEATCPSCGRAVRPQDNFCEACRTELAPAVVSGEAPRNAAVCAFCQSSQISADGYCESCGHKLPSSRDHMEIDLGLLAGVTDRGLRHRRNEDAMALGTAELDSGPAAVAVVCDGVSSTRRPDEASLAAAQAAVQVLLAGVRTGEDLIEVSRDAVSAAQEAVAGLGEVPGSTPWKDPPSATFVSAVMTSEAVTLCWLGDSRAYWLGAGPDPAAQRLTLDDSVAGEMVAAGLLSEAEALALPQAHVVTGWVGADLAARSRCPDALLGRAVELPARGGEAGRAGPAAGAERSAWRGGGAGHVRSRGRRHGQRDRGPRPVPAQARCRQTPRRACGGARSPLSPVRSRGEACR